MDEMKEPLKRDRGTGKVFNKGKRVYIVFQYLGEKVEYATGERDTKQNRVHWDNWLDDALAAINDGKFIFSEALAGASPKTKAFFTKLEGNVNGGVKKESKIDPNSLTMGEVIKAYRDENIPNIVSISKKQAYLSKIRSRILPYFEKMPISKFTCTEVANFLGHLAGTNQSKETAKGLKKSLKRQTIFDTLTVLKRVWLTACNQHKLVLPDPFFDTDSYIPSGRKMHKAKGIKPNIPVWRFQDAMKIIGCMEASFINVTKLMFLTGLSASEIAGIRKQDIKGNSLEIVNFKPRYCAPKDEGKTPFRTRAIRITTAMRACLDEAERTASDEYLFRASDGNHFSCVVYYKPWVIAVKEAGVQYMKPYSTRHTFAAWSLVAGILPDLLVDIMGHGSKEMVYEVYGKWREDLQKDAENIRHFFGEDFGK